MADECLRSAISKLNLIQHLTRELVLKREQEIAVKELLAGKHVLAVLPTGYGKSLIFTLFLLARKEMSRFKSTASDSHSRSSVLIISPLQSIIQDQITEMLSLGCAAEELSNDNLSAIVSSPPQFIYALKMRLRKHSLMDLRTAVPPSINPLPSSLWMNLILWKRGRAKGTFSV